jgi:hypothetical protein
LQAPLPCIIQLASANPNKLLYLLHAIKSQSTVFQVFNQQLTDITGTLQYCLADFKVFLQKIATPEATWKFWVQFVCQDAMAYVGLFLAIRSGDWHLSMASIKQMAPIFTALDHPTYQKLISRHIADVLCMPQSILTMFHQGAFVVSISGRGHSVGIDEAHEMLINKAGKTSIVRPSYDYINRIAHYIPYRMKAMENLKQQLFLEEAKQKSFITSPYSNNRNDYKREMNIISQMKVVSDTSLLPVTATNHGLIYPFTNKSAMPEQTNDLLIVLAIGHKEFLLWVSCHILKQPSTRAPKRKRRLLTFSEKRTTKQRVTQLEKDRKLILSCMRIKMKWSQRTGNPINKLGEQLLELPLALSDHEGNPNKGEKSYMSKALEPRYKSSIPQVFSSQRIGKKPNSHADHKTDGKGRYP